MGRRSSAQNAPTHTRTYIHTYIHTHIHTYIHRSTLVEHSIWVEDQVRKMQAKVSAMRTQLDGMTNMRPRHRESKSESHTDRSRRDGDGLLELKRRVESLESSVRGGLAGGASSASPKALRVDVHSNKASYSPVSGHVPVSGHIPVSGYSQVSDSPTGSGSGINARNQAGLYGRNNGQSYGQISHGVGVSGSPWRPGGNVYSSSVLDSDIRNGYGYGYGNGAHVPNYVGGVQDYRRNNGASNSNVPSTGQNSVVNSNGKHGGNSKAGAGLPSIRLAGNEEAEAPRRDGKLAGRGEPPGKLSFPHIRR
jgi:hypothetical protein